MFIVVDLIEQVFGECTYYRLFVITYHILKELIDEFDFEVCQVESSVIIAVELIRQVEQDFIFFTLLFRVQEFVYKSVTDVSNLIVACNQAVESERYLIADIQVSQTLIFVRDKYTLY